MRSTSARTTTTRKITADQEGDSEDTQQVPGAIAGGAAHKRSMAACADQNVPARWRARLVRTLISLARLCLLGGFILAALDRRAAQLFVTSALVIVVWATVVSSGLISGRNVSELIRTLLEVDETGHGQEVKWLSRQLSGPSIRGIPSPGLWGGRPCILA
jgi:hypothetical protein